MPRRHRRPSDSVTVCVDHRRAEPAEVAGHVREISTGRDRDTDHATRVGVVGYRDLEGIGRVARLGLDRDRATGARYRSEVRRLNVAGSIGSESVTVKSTTPSLSTPVSPSKRAPSEKTRGP